MTRWWCKIFGWSGTLISGLGLCWVCFSFIYLYDAILYLQCFAQLSFNRATVSHILVGLFSTQFMYADNACCSYARRSDDGRSMLFCLPSGNRIFEIEVDLWKLMYVKILNTSIMIWRSFYSTHCIDSPSDPSEASW